MDGQLMNTFIAFIAALCSLGFSILTIAAFAVGMDNVTLGLLLCMAVVSFGHAVHITQI